MQVRDYKRLVSRLLWRNISKPLCDTTEELSTFLSRVLHIFSFFFLFLVHITNCRIQDRRVKLVTLCSDDRCAKRASAMEEVFRKCCCKLELLPITWHVWGWILLWILIKILRKSDDLKLKYRGKVFWRIC